MAELAYELGCTVIELGASYDSLDLDTLDDVGSLLLTQAATADPPRLGARYVADQLHRFDLHRVAGADMEAADGAGRDDGSVRRAAVLHRSVPRYPIGDVVARLPQPRRQAVAAAGRK